MIAAAGFVKSLNPPSAKVWFTTTRILSVNVSLPTPPTDTVAVPGSSKIVVPVTFVVLPMSVSVTNALMNKVPSRTPEPIVVSVTTIPSAFAKGTESSPTSAKDSAKYCPSWSCMHRRPMAIEPAESVAARLRINSKYVLPGAFIRDLKNLFCVGT